MRPTEDGIYLADGRVDLSQLEERLGVDLLPADEEAEAATLAGLIFKIAGRVPARGEIICHESGLEFEILDSDPRRVKRVRINARNVIKPKAEREGDLPSS
ncbi:MAG: transporter associated domain-containing protein [bacterium]